MSDYIRITDRKIEMTYEGVEALMTDYTPTTEEVRADYCLLADVSRPRQLQFDRWLAEVKAQERERIIALLKDRYRTLMEIVSDCAPEGDSQHIMMDALNDANNLERIIALIKGEEQ